MAEQIIKGVTLAGETVAPLSARLVTSDSFAPGNVLLCPTPSFRHFSQITASAAMLCSVGTRTGHLSGICRARGIPVILVEESDLLGLQPGVGVLVDPRHGTVAAIGPDVIRPAAGPAPFAPGQDRP
jgi:hypothetical protein